MRCPGTPHRGPQQLCVKKRRRRQGFSGKPVLPQPAPAASAPCRPTHRRTPSERRRPGSTSLGLPSSQPPEERLSREPWRQIHLHAGSRAATSKTAQFGFAVRFPSGRFCSKPPSSAISPQGHGRAPSAPALGAAPPLSSAAHAQRPGTRAVWPAGRRACVEAVRRL